MTRGEIEDEIHYILQIDGCTFDESVKKIADLIEYMRTNK